MTQRSKTRTVGYGWVGQWVDGTIGWMLPRFLGGHSRKQGIEGPNLDGYATSKDDYPILCKITVEVVRDKRGRLIRRPWKRESK